MVRARGQRPAHLLLTWWICLVIDISGAAENQSEQCTTIDGRPGLCVVVKYCREAVESFPHQLPTVCYQKGPHPFACCPLPKVALQSDEFSVGSSRDVRLDGSRAVPRYPSTGETPWSVTPTTYNRPTYTAIQSSRTTIINKPTTRESTRMRTHFPRATEFEPSSTDSRNYNTRNGYTTTTRATYTTTKPRIQPSRTEYTRRKTSAGGADSSYANTHPGPSIGDTRGLYGGEQSHGRTERERASSHRTNTVPQYHKSTVYPTREHNVEASRSYPVRDDFNRPAQSSRLPDVEVIKTEIRLFNNPTNPVTTNRRVPTVPTPTKYDLPPQSREEERYNNNGPPPTKVRPKPTYTTHTPPKNSTKYSPSYNVPIISEAGCGEPVLELFVAGGTESRPGDWPWMVAVYRIAPPGRPNKFICGGVLVNRRHIVSAAHCFIYGNQTMPASHFLVRLGAHNRETMGEDHLITRLVVHEEYVARFHDHDIAILYLRNAVPYTKMVQPVCLPGPELANEDFVGRKAIVIGWGDASIGGGYSKVLNEVAVPVVAIRDCFAAYARLRSSSFPRGNMEQYICAGLPDGGKDACQGDSGGPLLVKGNEGRWVAIGIVSFGFRCAEPGFPGVYSRVAYYLSWIERAIYNI